MTTTEHDDQCERLSSFYICHCAKRERLARWRWRHDHRGKGQAADQYVTMTLRDFVALLGGETS